MAWRGSISRSLISTARATAFRSSPAAPRLRPPSLSAPRLQSRRSPFANPRKERKRWVMHSSINDKMAEKIMIS